MSQNPDRKTVGILLYQHAIMGDYAMAAEAFRVADMGSAFEVFSIGRSLDPIETMDGLVNGTKASRSISDVSELDVLVVPGGDWMATADDQVLHDWIRRLAANGTIVLSVCSGAYLLAQAGVLDGKRATSLPVQLDILREIAPKAVVVEGPRFVADGNIVTASGGGTGLDGALYVIGEIAGAEKADWVAKTYFDYQGWTDRR